MVKRNSYFGVAEDLVLHSHSVIIFPFNMMILVILKQSENCLTEILRSGVYPEQRPLQFLPYKHIIRNRNKVSEAINFHRE